jgi:hypothetical protein
VESLQGPHAHAGAPAVPGIFLLRDVYAVSLFSSSRDTKNTDGPHFFYEPDAGDDNAWCDASHSKHMESGRLSMVAALASGTLIIACGRGVGSMLGGR